MSGVTTHREDYARFLDAASGLPMSHETVLALSRAERVAWADPGKRYRESAIARQLLARSRTSVAAALDRRGDGVAFFPGTAEQLLTLAMRSAVTDRARSGHGTAGGPAGDSAGGTDQSAGVQLWLSPIEDVGVLRAAAALSGSPPPGVEVETHLLPVDGNGTVRPGPAIRASSSSPTVVVLQSANGEIGTRQPLEELADHDLTLVVDARHQIGRASGAVPGDLVICHPLNWGGPGGLSILLSRERGRLAGLLCPTDGSLGVEPAAPPVPLIAAAALSLESAVRTLDADQAASQALTDLLRSEVAARIPDATAIGHPEQRLPQIVMFSFLYVAADELVDTLSRQGWSVASGSACTRDTERPLHVLTEIGALTHGNLRISLPPWTTEDTIRAFLDDLEAAVARVRSAAGAGGI